MNYSVYDSTAYAKGLESRNGLFSALIIIGVSRNDEVLDCISVETRYNELKKRYYDNEKSFGLCNRGIKYICALLRDSGIPIRKRKCLNYVFTRGGKRFYTDISITSFAKALMQTINTDEALLKLLNEVLSSECKNYSNDIGNPRLGDCVQHIYGFQYECLSRIVRNRAFPNSRKSTALRECLGKMDTIVSVAGYPKCI